MNEAIELRSVESFPEPAFTDLVDRLLHDPDRRSLGRLFLGPAGTPPTASQAGVFCVSSSAVDEPYRHKGVYTRLVAAMEDAARTLGCGRIESHHRAANTPVLIAKLKAGYLIVGTEFTGEMGLLVKLSKQLAPQRHALFHARAGTLEGAARYFRQPRT